MIEGLLTQGQFLSLFMYLFSAAFLIFAFRSGSKTAAFLFWRSPGVELNMANNGTKPPCVRVGKEFMRILLVRPNG